MAKRTANSLRVGAAKRPKTGGEGDPKLADKVVLLQSVVGSSARVVLDASLGLEYGTVEAKFWDRKPPTDAVPVANFRASEQELRDLPTYHSGGVSRNRGQVHPFDRNRDAPSADPGAPTIDVYLVRVVTIA